MSAGAMKPIHVGLLGFGTVGRGTWDVLRRNQAEIQRRAGRPIVIDWIATRTLDRAREGTRGVAGVNLTNDPSIVVRHPTPGVAAPSKPWMVRRGSDTPAFTSASSRRGAASSS